MSHDISFQDLIDKVKTDLFAPYENSSQKGKSVYPIFFVDQVELELNIEIGFDANAGLKISLPQIVEGSLEGGQSKTKGHSMKITLKPILTPEEIRALIKKDERLMKGVEEASLMSLRKGSQLSGHDE